MNTITLYSRLRAGDLFDNLDPEKVQESEKKFNKEGSVLEQMLAGLEKTNDLGIENLDYENEYLPIEALAYKGATKKEIQGFLTFISQSDGISQENLSTYLSALINNSLDRTFRFSGNNFVTYLEGFGSYLRKNLIILGDASRNLGNELDHGRICVKGNTGPWTGLNMKDGLIYIQGDSNLFLGAGMKGGRIVVRGNADGYVGEKMNGGEIHLFGDYELSQDIQGGNIYHQGELIVKDGRKVK